VEEITPQIAKSTKLIRATFLHLSSDSPACAGRITQPFYDQQSMDANHTSPMYQKRGTNPGDNIA
jgi:hypothetical protein